MQTIKAIRWFLGVLLTGLIATSALAEQKKIFYGPDGAEYEVHYIAFNSTFLQPDIAQRYGITRSRAIGVINVSVLKKNEEGKMDAVGALVDMNAKNDIQQVQHISFDQIVEGKSIYYVGQVQYREGEVLTFQSSVFPQGIADPFKLRFTHQFFND